MGMDIQYLWEGGEPYMVDLAFYWGTWKPLRNHVILSYPYKFMSGYLYFHNSLKDIKDHIYADMRSCKIFLQLMATVFKEKLNL